jgi:hypothetical protein
MPICEQRNLTAYQIKSIDISQLAQDDTPCRYQESSIHSPHHSQATDFIAGLRVDL